ncbi:hypothetical protein BHM03_00047360, partial [Ensete ventricosum]
MKRHRRIESHVARMTKPIQQRACFGPAAGVGAVALLAGEGPPTTGTVYAEKPTVVSEPFKKKGRLVDPEKRKKEKMAGLTVSVPNQLLPI